MFRILSAFLRFLPSFALREPVYIISMEEKKDLYAYIQNMKNRTV